MAYKNGIISCNEALRLYKDNVNTHINKQLTRKVGVKFYGFIFWLKRIFLGKLGIKNVLTTMRKHCRTAALLHDVFRKPHRQKVYLKLKQNQKPQGFYQPWGSYLVGVTGLILSILRHISLFFKNR